MVDQPRQRVSSEIRRKVVLTPAERKLVRLILSEIDIRMRKRYQLDVVIPYILRQRAAAITWNRRARAVLAVLDFLGVDKAKRKRFTGLVLVLLVLAIAYDWRHAVDLALRIVKP